MGGAPVPGARARGLSPFQLSKDECLRSQIATLNGKRGEHTKYLPYAFTGNGIAMLSSVLRSETAIKVNIHIMRASVGSDPRIQ